MVGLNSLPGFGLYAILNTRGQTPETLGSAAQQALDGGAVLLQLRDKSNDKQYRRHCALAVSKACAARGAALLINDDTELAKSTGAAGVHLGRSDSGIAAARKYLGENALIGATCHSDLEYAERAIAAGANYVSFGRFFDSRTKPDAPAAHLSVLTQASAQFAVPVVAIGGINADNASRVLDAGADLLAVSGAVFDQGDITLAAQTFTKFFQPCQ